MIDTPDLTPEAVTHSAATCLLLDENSILELDCRSLFEALATERARADKAEAERDAAIAAGAEASRLRGVAEGKMLAAETPGVLEGWMRRAEAAEARRASARDDALEEAARAVEKTPMRFAGQTESVVRSALARAIRAMKGG